MLTLRIGNFQADLAPGTYDIGRDPASHIFIDGSLVSWSHARLAVGSDEVATVTDLGSRNGTLVNGQRLEPQVATELGPGDEVEIGTHVLTIEGLRVPAGRSDAREKVDVRSCPGCGALLGVRVSTCPTCALKLPGTTIRRPVLTKQTLELGPIPVGGVVALLSGNQVLLDALAPAFGSNQGVLSSGAGTLFDVLRRVFPRRPDLLLVDQSLPVLDKDEVANWRRTLPDVTIGIFGDEREEEGIQNVARLGADVYFRQPSSAIAFVAKVRLLLAHARLTSGAADSEAPIAQPVVKKP